MSKFKAAADILLAAKSQINVILTGEDAELHRLRLEQSLQREADYILLVTGSGDIQSNTGVPVLGPAQTIGGKPISKIRKIQEADLLPSDDKVLNLKQQVESALVYFGPDSDPAGILVNIPDQVIRGVAKKAGFAVTKEDPKIITVEFIEQVKAALNKEGGDASIGKSSEPVETESKEPIPGQQTEGFPGEEPLHLPAAPPVETKSVSDETNAQFDETNQPKTESRKTKAGK